VSVRLVDCRPREDVRGGHVPAPSISTLRPSSRLPADPGDGRPAPAAGPACPRRALRGARHRAGHVRARLRRRHGLGRALLVAPPPPRPRRGRDVRRPRPTRGRSATEEPRVERAPFVARVRDDDRSRRRRSARASTTRRSSCSTPRARALARRRGAARPVAGRIPARATRILEPLPDDAPSAPELARTVARA
jgi:hypothetical protein